MTSISVSVLIFWSASAQPVSFRTTIIPLLLPLRPASYATSPQPLLRTLPVFASPHLSPANYGAACPTPRCRVRVCPARSQDTPRACVTPVSFHAAHAAVPDRGSRVFSFVSSVHPCTSTGSGPCPSLGARPYPRGSVSASVHASKPSPIPTVMPPPTASGRSGSRRFAFGIDAPPPSGSTCPIAPGGSLRASTPHHVYTAAVPFSRALPRPSLPATTWARSTAPSPSISTQASRSASNASAPLCRALPCRSRPPLACSPAHPSRWRHAHPARGHTPVHLRIGLASRLRCRCTHTRLSSRRPPPHPYARPAGPSPSHSPRHHGLTPTPAHYTFPAPSAPPLLTRLSSTSPLRSSCMPRVSPHLHCSRTLLACAVTPAPPRPVPPPLAPAPRVSAPIYSAAAPPFRGLPRPCRAAPARTPVSVLARPASPTRGRQSPVHRHRRPVPHLSVPPHTLLSARLTRSASIAQLYPLPAPVLLHHSGAVKPLRADTLVVSHIHLATALHSLAIPAVAWTRPCAMYLPLHSHCPGPLLCHAGLSRAAHSLHPPCYARSSSSHLLTLAHHTYHRPCSCMRRPHRVCTVSVLPFAPPPVPLVLCPLRQTLPTVFPALLPVLLHIILCAMYLFLHFTTHTVFLLCFLYYKNRLLAALPWRDSS
jgi:hypothetical protein